MIGSRIRRSGARRLILALGLVAAAVGPSQPVAAADIDLAIGLERVEGTFLSAGSRRFDQLFLQAEFGGAGSRLTVRLPYLRVDHTGNVAPTPDGPIIVGAGGPGSLAWQESAPGDGESGIGDLSLRSDSYLVRAGKGNRPALSLVIDLKWPTASEKKGLGTGEYDYGAGLDYLQPLGQHFQILGAASYRFMGSPEGIDFDNRLRLFAGFAVVTPHTVWRLVGESISPVLDEVPVFDATGTAVGMTSVDDYRIVRGEAVFRNQAGGSMRLYALTGLNDSSADLGFGIVFASRAL